MAKLLGVLLTTTFIMLLISYKFYDLDLKITLIYLSFELVNFIIYPVYKIKICYLQLTKLAKEVTTNKIIAGIVRFLLSLLKTPYCTGIGQVTSSLYQFLTINSMFSKNYKVNSNGQILKK